jgi:hypothetical protein
MAMSEELSIEMIKEIHSHTGPFTRAKAALIDTRIREIFPNTPSLTKDQYQEIEWYIENHATVVSPFDIIIALKYLGPFKSELLDAVKIYAEKAANLIKGKTPQQIRDTFILASNLQYINNNV